VVMMLERHYGPRWLRGPDDDDSHIWYSYVYNLLNYSEGFLCNRVSGMRFLVLHDIKNEEGIKNFCQDVYETYVKVCILIIVQ